MAEHALWRTLQGKLRNVPQFIFQRHEDKFSEGIPDTSFSGMGHNGWIELKFAAKWPVRATTPLRLPHYTPEQRIWLREHGEAGGRCWLFLQVGNEYLLFDWRASQQVGKATRVELYNLAMAKWDKNINILEFCACIIKNSLI